MTTYTSIANGAVDAGSPIDEALVTALRDNPLAIQEGDASAPAIEPAAFASNQGTPAAGNVGISSGAGMVTTSGTTVYDGIIFTIKITGTYRIRAQVMTVASTGTNPNLTLYIRDGTTTITSSLVSTNAQAGVAGEVTTDYACTAGDDIRVSISSSSGDTVQAVLTSSVCADDVAFINDRVGGGASYLG